VLFRKAFAAAPICSGSRASLLTGQASHSSGMLGLAHRGFRLVDYDHHLVHTLHDAHYWTALIGEQHVSADPAEIGYDHVVEVDSHHASEVAPATVALLADAPRRPFFLSVGFFETHRDFFEPTSARDALYSLPPGNLPDTPETRRDMAGFKQSARSLDQGVGEVLNALDEHDMADDTLVLLTTDHGLAFPGAKATLSDRGLGVMLIMRGPGGFHGGKVVDAMVSQVDLFPTLCELVGLPRPAWLQGRSLLPLVRREVDAVNDAVFAEMTFHAAYDPQRAVRTDRYKYIRRFDESWTRPVLPNIDDSPSKSLLLDHGWADREVPREELYDLVFDPNEARNLVGEPQYEPVLAELRERLERWMRETADPLLDGPLQPPPGTELNDPGQRSSSDPTRRSQPA
jgi:N-sulfoglucosamine sulfohydrolase